LDLAKILLLGLGGMGGGTLDILAYLPLVIFGIGVSFAGFLLNCKEIHFLNNISLSLAVCLFQLYL